MEPINDTNRVNQDSLGLSIKSSNPEEFPIAYSDNIWDIVLSGTNLARLLENIGSFDQHTINELFASMFINSELDPGTSLNNDFNNDFGN